MKKIHEPYIEIIGYGSYPLSNEQDSQLPTTVSIMSLINDIKSYIEEDITLADMKLLNFLLEQLEHEIADNDYFYIDPPLNALERFAERYISDQGKRDVFLQTVDHIRSSTLE